MKTLGIIGRKDSGKTHLVVRLVAELRRRGLTVSTIKHTHHHDVEPDAPGKDSFRHREAGAGEVIVASDRRWYLVHEVRDEAPPDLAALVARLARCDVVLVEGYKTAATYPRIEVYRPTGTPPAEPLAAGDPGVLAVACPAVGVPARWPATAMRLDLDDTTAIADFVIATVR